MKKFLSVVLFLFLTVWNVFAEEVFKSSDLEETSKYREEYMWMSCAVTEYDLWDNGKLLEAIFNKDWSFILKDPEIDRWYEISSFPNPNIITKNGETVLDLPDWKWLVWVNYPDNFKDSFVIYPNGIDYAYVWVEEGKKWYWVYKNDELLYEDFEYITWIKLIDGKLIFYWIKDGGKGFIYEDWEVKDLPIEDSSIYYYEKIGSDIYVKYETLSEVEDPEYEFNYDFYIYKNGKEIFKKVGNKYLNSWVLTQNDIYAIWGLKKSSIGWTTKDSLVVGQRILLWYENWSTFKKYECVHKQQLEYFLRKANDTLQNSPLKGYIPKLDSLVENVENEKLDKFLDILAVAPIRNNYKYKAAFDYLEAKILLKLNF